jgi:hypothetical protein
MNHAHQDGSPPGDSSPSSLRVVFQDAARYWERGRIGYNAVLIAVALAWLVFTWPHFRPAFSWQSALIMLVLATLANACYCAAYPIDIIFQRLPFSFAWKRRRWVLWCVGTLFAAGLACYWIADEIYPYVR